MTNFLINTCLSIGLGLLLLSCNEDKKSEVQIIEGDRSETQQFYAVDIGLYADVEIESSDKFSYQIDGSAEDLENVSAEISKGRLSIDVRRGERIQNKLSIHITAEGLQAIEMSGAGDINIGSNVVSDKQTILNVSGSGDITLQASNDMEKLLCILSGSGSINARGTGYRLESLLSGSGRIDASEFECESANVKISGSGNCEIHVKQDLDVTISGSGDVYYKGRPDINKRITGSGNVKELN